jgi:activating signal cointegrator 1
MKVLTIQQPYATLILLKAKQYETRRWLTPHRGPLLIHAGRHYQEANKRLLFTEPFKSILEQHGIYQFQDLPFGAILGQVTLGCIEPAWQISGWQTDQELNCGFWGPGNYAWRLDQPQPWQKPLFTSGQPGLWEIRHEVLAQHLGPNLAGVA